MTPDRIPLVLSLNPLLVIALILAVGLVPPFTKHPAMVRTLMVIGFLSLFFIPVTKGGA